MARHPNVVNESELDWIEGGSGSRFSSQRKQLTAATGAEKLGASLFRVPPGKCAFPQHYHYANEEGVYILEGSGVMRLGDQRVKVGQGDYIAMPVGPQHAHQLINDSDQPLTYLCISTMTSPEVVGYPDSQKIGAIAGSAPGGRKMEGRVAKFFPQDADVNYWDGES